MAGIQSHYEINVSLNGKHFFATDARSCVTEFEAKRVYTELSQRFPVTQGYEVSCTHWRCGGTSVTFDVPKPVIKTLEEMERENPDGFRNPE